MTRSEAINKVLAALGAGGTVLAHGPDPQAIWARQLVDVAAALELIRLDAEPPMNWDKPDPLTGIAPGKD